MNRCISKKEYLKKGNSNVGYALYVQNNIKKDDYARLNTGQIVRIIGIRENELNKKAIYFNIYNEDWCESAAVENFSDNIIDLIEIEDIIEAVTEEDFEEEYTDKLEVAAVGIKDGQGNKLNEIGICGEHGIEFVDLKDIRKILTHEQYEKYCYTVEEEE